MGSGGASLRFTATWCSNFFNTHFHFFLDACLHPSPSFFSHLVVRILLRLLVSLTPLYIVLPYSHFFTFVHFPCSPYFSICIFQPVPAFFLSTSVYFSPARLSHSQVTAHPAFHSFSYRLSFHAHRWIPLLSLPALLNDPGRGKRKRLLKRHPAPRKIRPTPVLLGAFFTPYSRAVVLVRILSSLSPKTVRQLKILPPDV